MENETNYLLECSNCNARVECKPDKTLDESKYSLEFCPFCGEEDVETEELD